MNMVKWAVVILSAHLLMLGPMSGMSWPQSGESTTPQTAYTPERTVTEFGKAVVLIAGVKDGGNTISLGSGFLVTSDGQIVTNYHVIRGAWPAVVKLTNGNIYSEISVVGYDARRDVAVIKVNGSALPVVKLGNSDEVKVGEKVVVIGNPQGLENTVSDGLLSGVRENVQGYTMHQITAPISPGSSGSPVFNLRGEVIGMATSFLVEGQNLNFSLPIKYARELIGGQVRYGLKDLPDEEPAERQTTATSPEQMLALVFFRTEDSFRFQPEIFPLALYSQDKFIDAAVYPEDEVGRQSSLSRFEEFSIYRDGRRVGEMKATGIVSREYGAVEVLVGVGPWELPAEYWRSSEVLLEFGSSDGNSSGYKLMEPFLACSSLIPSADLKMPLTDEMQRKARSGLEQKAKAALGAIAAEPKKLRIQRRNFRSFDLDRDGVPEVMGTFSATVKSYRLDGVDREDVAYYFIIARFRDSGLQVLYTETQVEAPQIIGWGPYMIDALDIDDDGKAEVVVHQRESGWLYFSVLGFKDGKIKSLFSGGGIGH